jgi:hypothetical protein
MTAIWLPACTDNSPAAIRARTFIGAVVIVVGERREPPGEPVHDGPAGLGVSPHRLAGDFRHAASDPCARRITAITCAAISSPDQLSTRSSSLRPVMTPDPATVTSTAPSRPDADTDSIDTRSESSCAACARAETLAAHESTQASASSPAALNGIAMAATTPPAQILRPVTVPKMGRSWGQPG